MAQYNNLYTTLSDGMPLQSIPLKDKLSDNYEDTGKSWGMVTMDALEQIGKRQYSNNIPLVENYEMVRGRFIYNHYFHTEGYSDMVTQLTAELEMPNYLKHYDLIGQVINEMIGEWTRRPDLFKVTQLGDGATNEYMRAQTDMLKDYVGERIMAEINAKLVKQGIDINKSDFSSQEEQQQYQQQLEQTRQSMTPKEIQDFMDTEFLTNAEIWGSHQLEYDKEVFSLPEKEVKEFEDMLTVDRCFRHFYIDSYGHQQETWNPINVFMQKSAEIDYTEDGDYVGRVFNLSVNTILDRYGFKMDKKDFDMLLDSSKSNKSGDKKWTDSAYNWVYDQYLVPFEGYPTYDIMKTHWNKYADGSIPQLDENLLARSGDPNYVDERKGFYFVTEAYWKTQKCLIKLTYIDEETGELAIDIVDENVIIPKYFVESDKVFAEQHDINTYVKTYVPEVWKGVKINTKKDKDIDKDLYIGIGPNEFQFKGDINIYGCKLPVCGQVFNERNGKSASLADLMKPHQIGYNVAMNQLYQLAEKEIGMFMIFDVNMFVDSKDWGGEDSWGKWMMMAKNLGMLPADTSPSNIKNSLAATSGHLPKILDLNLASQMISRMNMAKFFEEQALKQVGFNQYRLGTYSQTSTATGVTQGTQASYNQTESYFTNFSNYLKRCYQMDLDIAQYVQSKKETIELTYIKSDLNRAFIKVLGSNLLLSKLGIRVVSNQEHARQLDMIRQYALQNATGALTPPDVTKIISMNSVGEIRRELEKSYANVQAQQQQAQQAQQQQAQQAIDLNKENQALLYDDHQKNRDNELNIERLKLGMSIINTPPANDTSALDAMKHQDNQNNIAQDNNLKERKLSLEERKAEIDARNKDNKLSLDKDKIQANLQIQHERVQSAKIMKGQNKK